MTAPSAGQTASALPASGIRAIASLAWSIPDAIHLEFGEPDFDTPQHIVQACERALRHGETRYAPSAGLPALREAICLKTERDNGLTGVTPEHVVVAAGGVGALTLAYRALLEAGDEVLVPDPGWPNLANIARTVGARPVPYRLDPAHGYRPDLTGLEGLVSGRTRAVVINSPSNPLGCVWDQATLAQLAEFARRHDLWVISDECYDQLWLDEPSPPMIPLAPERTVSVYSCSKSYAMTGWRLGYAVGPPSAVSAMVRVQETVASCVNTAVQFAAVEALTGPQDCVAAMRAAYRSRRQTALARTAECGLAALRPAGAFYLWITLPAWERDSAAFATRLLREEHVACAPGAAFGAYGEGHLRVSLAASASDISRGITAISSVLEEPCTTNTAATAQARAGGE